MLTCQDAKKERKGGWNEIKTKGLLMPFFGQHFVSKMIVNKTKILYLSTFKYNTEV